MLHSFRTGAASGGAHLIPGGEFFVLLYIHGHVGLHRIERSEAGNLDLREVARYEEPNKPWYAEFRSELLTEISHGCPVLVRMRVSGREG